MIMCFPFSSLRAILQFEAVTSIRMNRDSAIVPVSIYRYEYSEDALVHRMPLRCKCFKQNRLRPGTYKWLYLTTWLPSTHDELAFVFQIRSLSGRSTRHSIRTRPADPTMLTASSGSSNSTSLVGSSAPNAQNRTDGSIILWST